MTGSKIVDSLHPLERKVLPLVKEAATAAKIATEAGLSEVEVLRALQWLENKQLVTTTALVIDSIELDSNGRTYATQGLPEARLLKALGKEETAASRAAAIAGLQPEELQAALGILKQKGAMEIRKDKELVLKKVQDIGEFPEEKFLRKKFPVLLASLNPGERQVLEQLKKRKNFVKSVTQKIVEAKLTQTGKELLKQGIDAESIEHLTPEILRNSSWKGKSFRRFDLNSPAPKIYAGRRHFVQEATSYVKRIWLDLGFAEMKGNIVQSAFWNLDALFVPQDHPAREMQDTFFLDKTATLPPVAAAVAEAHQKGVAGSRGWGGEWTKAKAQKVLLRTHTTVLSALTLAGLNADKPSKHFVVGKVFRNETLDWKHLFEFTQVDGIVVDRNATLRQLFGYLKTFYKKMGYSNVRLRPSFFPYTEPSLEVEVWHPTRKEWVELGGAGILRPEVVVPLLGEDIPVLAWGLGLERILTEYYRITDLRDIYRNDASRIREAPLWIRKWQQ